MSKPQDRRDEMTEVPDFLPVLSRGNHVSPRDGACFAEYASFLAGERFTDYPECADRTLAQICQGVNDASTDEQRQRLAPLIPRLIGTRVADWEASPELRKWAADHNLAHSPHAHEYGAFLNGFWAISLSGNDPVEFLTAAFDKFDELTGRAKTPEATPEQLAQMRELVGVRGE